MRYPAAILPFALASTSFALPVAAAEPAAATAPAPVSSQPRSPRPPVTLALLCGIVTALIPIGLGAAFMASSPTDGGKNVGLVVAGAGVALSPIAGHVVLGEFQRAAAFGAVPVAGEVATAILVSAQPDAVFHGTKGSRGVFALSFSLGVFGAAVGLVDVLRANERARSRPLTLAPMVGAGRYGFALGGTL